MRRPFRKTCSIDSETCRLRSGKAPQMPVASSRLSVNSGHEPGLASFGESPSPGASTLFGTQHILTGQWVRLVKPIRGRSRPFVRPILPSLPMGSSENRGRHDCNHASSTPPGPRPFSWGGVTIPMVMTVRFEKRPLASFGESPLARGIGTFRNPAHPNGSMGSFGQTGSREKPPVCATHPPELANGFL
jgi:hypothetical protein